MISLKHDTKRRGLTLTESAIVLGIFGLIAGAIWGSFGTIQREQKVQDAMTIVMQTATNVRGVYTGFPNATTPSTIAAQISANLFPASIVPRTGATTQNPWGGTVQIRFPAAPVRGFSVELSLPSALDKVERRAACFSMVTKLLGTETNYTGGSSQTLPSATVPREQTQGNTPSLAYLYLGGSWVDVTRATDSLLSTYGSADCTGIGYYFTL